MVKVRVSRPENHRLHLVRLKSQESEKLFKHRAAFVYHLVDHDAVQSIVHIACVLEPVGKISCQPVSVKAAYILRHLIGVHRLDFLGELHQLAVARLHEASEAGESLLLFVSAQEPESVQVFSLWQRCGRHPVLVHLGAIAVAHVVIEFHIERKQHRHGVSAVRGVILEIIDHVQGDFSLLIQRVHAESHKSLCLFHLPEKVYIKIHDLHGRRKNPVLKASEKLYIHASFHVADGLIPVMRSTLVIQRLKRRI